MSDGAIKQAARLFRRWRGVGPLLFMVFYSLFFAAHLRLEKTVLYVRDEVLLSADTASFFTGLTTGRAAHGADAAGEGAFLLVHHAPTRLLTAAWVLFSDSPAAAARHAVAALTSAAGALSVTLLYLTLMWCGVARSRAALFACVLGGSAALGLAASVPQPQVFSALGFTAALAALARGRAASWWEFPAAALYSACCSIWNVIPMLLLGLAGVVRDCREGGSLRPVWSGGLSAALLLLAALGAMGLQGGVQKGGSAFIATVTREARETLDHALRQSPRLNWQTLTQDALIHNVVASSEILAPQEDSRKRVVSIEDGRVFVPGPHHVPWLVLLVAGMAGLPFAFARGGMVAPLLAAGGWLLWFHPALELPGERLLRAALWTPAIIALAALGLEPLLRRPWLRWAASVLLVAVLWLQITHHSVLLAAMARRLSL